MTAAKRLGLLGGTFDPVHFGHLDAADAARSMLALDEVLLIPARDQPLRADTPRTPDYQRFALLSLAIADRAAYRLSDVELVRPGKSYTLDTLQAFHREGWRATQLFFIVGADAFATIAAWHGFPLFLDLAHFVVVARPGTLLDDAIPNASGVRDRVQTVAPDTTIDAGPTCVFLVPARTRDVSSTQVRGRLAASESIDDLVPTLVARHITKHHLYRAVDDLHDQNERI